MNVSRQDAARLLHGALCRSEQPCSHPMSVYAADAARLSACESLADAAEVVHDVICDAEIDQTFAGCPERARHVAWLAERPSLSRHWPQTAAQGAPFEENAA